MSFSNLSNYATKADQALSERQALFSRDVENEQTKEEKEASLMEKIQGVTVPFGEEMLKSGGAKLGSRVLTKLGLGEVNENFVKQVLEEPNKAASQLFNKAKTDLTKKGNNAINQGLKDLKNRVVKNAGVSLDDENELPDLTSFKFGDPVDKTARVSFPDDIELKPLNKGGGAYSDLKNKLGDMKIEDNPFSFKNFTSSFNDVKTTPLSQPKATAFSSKKFYEGESDPFKSISGYDDIIDDVKSGKSSLLNGLFKSQVRANNAGKLPLQGLRGNKKLSPKILDLQQKTNLKPGKILTQDNEQEIQGMVNKAPKAPNIQATKTSQIKIQNPPVNNSDIQKANKPDITSSGSTEINSTKASKAQADIQAQGDIQDDIQSTTANAVNNAKTSAVKSAVSTGEDLESGLQKGLKAATTAVGEIDASEAGTNIIGDVIEAGLGIATLFSSVFGTKVSHDSAEIPDVGMASTGFGIKSQ
jgi:hypothetical protein